ncbi:MAG: anti-sigma factor [Chloroflexi bacterium]|nr:anti-sigma factor [Chloroflexota bacterium]MBV9602321.1 anti-sigma factor [Chloroflexota bacterium]
MMPGSTSFSCEEFLDLAAGVALDAADADDVRRVEEHAQTCPACRGWFDELRTVAAGLGTLAPQLDPPPAVRERIFEAVRREPRPFGVVRRLLPRSGARRPRLSAAWLVAAASFIVAIAALAWVAILQLQITDLRNQALAAGEREARIDRVVSVLASDKLAIKPLQPAAAAVASSGYVFMDPNSGTGMLMCHDLPPVEQGHAYQVWFVRGNDRVSAGMLWPDHSGDGYTMIQVPPDVQSFDSIGLTDEPGNGSAWPTTPRVIGAPIK